MTVRSNGSTTTASRFLLPFSIVDSKLSKAVNTDVRSHKNGTVTILIWNVVRKCSETDLSGEWNTTKATHVEDLTTILGEQIGDVAFFVIHFVGTNGLGKQRVLGSVPTRFGHLHVGIQDFL